MGSLAETTDVSPVYFFEEMISFFSVTLTPHLIKYQFITIHMILYYKSLQKSTLFALLTLNKEY